MHIGWIDIGPGTVISLVFLFLLIRSIIRLGRTYMSRHDPRYRIELSYRVFAVVFTLACFALPAYLEFRIQFANAYASSMTRKVVGNNEVHARCQRGLADMLEIKSISYAGWVEGKPGTKRSNLTSQICGHLISWVLSDKQHASRDQLIALHVVIHEAVHLTGEYSEAETEYKTTEYFEGVVVSMGASQSEAKRMNDYYKSEVNPHMPEAYRVDFAAREQRKADAQKQAEGN
ncbi:hypothetical protein E6P97_04140 [Patescibacteria group bacterium]|nr:MAG: hypothetical protein E6P97_04140 [Patescibacteria group bacterium]